MEGDGFDPLLWGVWLFIGIGGVALAGAVFWLNKRIGILRAGGRAQGTVVGTKSSSGSKGKTTHRPVVEFRTPDGRVHTVVGSTGTSSGGPHVGNTVRVAYDPANPDRAFLLTFVQGWLGPLALTIFGAGFLGLGMMALQVVSSTDYLEADARMKAMQQRVEAMQDGEDEEVVVEGTRPGETVPADVSERFKRP